MTGLKSRMSNTSPNPTSSPRLTRVEHTTFPVRPYDLAATLNSGQAFRWRPAGAAFEGVVGRRWARLEPCAEGIRAETPAPVPDWDWLASYLQVGERLDTVLATFPDDPILDDAVRHFPGLRLLRQNPWECLASFILSATKQIVQIRQMIGLLCARYGEPVPVPMGHAPEFAFPAPERLAQCTEADLRACKLGFRAPSLRATAQRVAAGRPDLATLASLGLEQARETLLTLPGVGRKIADCVLLFAYGFPQAFPIDVWIERALRRLYFPRRRVTPSGLRRFAATHFGPRAGYAQQYLFHYIRTVDRQRFP